MTRRPSQPPGKQPTLWHRGAVLVVFALVVVAACYAGLPALLDFESLRENRALLQGWVEAHYALTVMLFMALYMVAVASSLPGAVWLTLAGGFLFGVVPATIYVVVGATAGATLVFFLARYVFRASWKRKAGPMLQRMEAGFHDHAFHYLLVLRLVPLFPFWLVNLVPAFLGVPLRVYVCATFLGIIPGAAVYASLGNGLDAVFEQGGTPNISLIWDPEVLLPLIALAILAMVPVAWRKWGRRWTRKWVGRVDA